MTTAGKQKNKKTIQQRIEEMEILSAQSVVESNPLISFNDQGIIWKKTINIIQGKFGSHKSRLAELFCSLLLKDKYCETDFIGLKRDELELCNVAYVDTERNKAEQFSLAIQKVRRKAGFEPTKKHPRLIAFSLLDSARKDRQADLKEFIENQTKRTSNHLFILLDVVTDCISNFNDAAETLELFDYLNQLINDFKLTFLLVIHENPGSDKARGHTGTEASNKASTIIQIGYEKGPTGNDSELIKLKFLKLRSGKRPGDTFLRYCPIEKGLVLAEKVFVDAFIQSRVKTADTKSVIEVLQEFLSKPTELQKVLAYLKENLEGSENTFKKRLEKIISEKIPLFNLEGQECRLVKTGGEGKKAYFSLEPKTQQL